MKSIKKILSVVLVLAMMAALGTQVFAENEERVTAIGYNSALVGEMVKENAAATGGYERVCHVGSISAMRGTSLPSSAWSFWDGVYSGSFSGVKSGIYTNYYFTGVNTLRLYFSGLCTQSGTAKLTYYLIDMSDNNSATGPYYSELLSTTSSDEVYKTFSGLTSSHNYCIWLRSNNTRGIDGNITISTTNGG
mgnify:FL=1